VASKQASKQKEATTTLSSHKNRKVLPKIAKFPFCWQCEMENDNYSKGEKFT